MAAAGDSLQNSLDLAGMPDLNTSLELVGRARGGDRAALDDLLGRYQERLRRIVRIKLGPRLRVLVESMDVVQNTYRVAFQRIEDFTPRDQASLLQWLAQIAENQIRDAHDYHFAQKRDGGKQANAKTRNDDQQDVLVNLPDVDQTEPPERAFKQELREILDDAITRLPDSFRQAILLRDYCGGSWEFVASELDRDTHAARQVHRRAWIKVRQMVWPHVKDLVEP